MFVVPLSQASWHNPRNSPEFPLSPEFPQRRLGARRTGKRQDADVALPQAVYPIERIDAAVAAHFRVGVEDLQRHGHSSGPAKFLAVELACRLTGRTQREIGTHYGRITSAAVSTIRRKIREGTYPLAELVDKMLRNVTRRRES